MITAVVLAAGRSARLGRPKQLLRFGDITLLGHAVTAALHSRCSSVAVVVGAGHDDVLAEARRFDVTIMENTDWKEGKASSIRAAVRAVESRSLPCSGLLFLACDQPRVTSVHLNRLIEGSVASGDRPAFSAYADTLGTPALVPRRWFPDLANLHGEEGAQSIASAKREELFTLPLPGGELDIDSEADWVRWFGPTPNHCP